MPTVTADTWEDLVNDGIEARKQGDGANWTLGDLAGRLETTYGAGDLQKYADRVGVGFASLQEYRRVASRFEKSRRLDNLTWSHHMVVAARDDAEALLARAERDGLTVDQLRALVKGVAHVSHNSGDNAALPTAVPSLAGGRAVPSTPARRLRSARTEEAQHA